MFRLCIISPILIFCYRFYYIIFIQMPITELKFILIFHDVKLMV